MFRLFLSIVVFIFISTRHNLSLIYQYDNIIKILRLFAAVISLCLLVSNSAYSEQRIAINSDSQRALGLYSNPQKLLIDKNDKAYSSSRLVDDQYGLQEDVLDSRIANELYSILSSHYIYKDTDPEYIQSDLKVIANYYSRYSDVVIILKALKGKNWRLVYDKNDWSTVAKGTIFQVNEAVLHFNTRNAAQLRLNNKCSNNPVCIASPADAMLHELLHTYSMLIYPDRFITQGGMSSVLYPYKHEYAVIEQENRLYSKMTSQDKIKRPHRNDHTGRNLKVKCAICIN